MVTENSGGQEGAAGTSALMKILSKVPIFQFLSPQQLAGVAAGFKLETYEPGQVIFNKDEIGTTLHVVAAGAVRIFLPAEGGEEAPLALLKSGDYFGELSLMDGGARTASAAAMGRTATLILDREDFIKFITTHPQGAEAVFRSMASLIRKQNMQLFGEFFGEER